MKNIKQKLSEVIVSEELNVDILLDIIRKFIKVNPEKHLVIPLNDFFKLKNKDAILMILLGFKVLKEWGTRETELVGPKDVALNSGINLSTVKNALRELEREKQVVSIKGKYSIPNFLLYILKDKFVTLNLEELPRKTTEKKGKRGERLDFSRINKILEKNPEELAGDFYEFLASTKGEYFKKSLILIKLAKEKFGIDGLTTAEITKILRDHLRVSMIHQSNISTALGAQGTSKYLLKQPTNRKKVFVYKLTKLGGDFINNMNLQLGKK